MEACYWLSEVSDDPTEKRSLLEEILANNFGDARARRKLAILDGKIKPEEIVDPDNFKPCSVWRTSRCRSALLHLPALWRKAQLCSRWANFAVRVLRNPRDD